MDHDHFAALAQTLAPSRRSALASLLATASGLAGWITGEAKQKGPDCGKRAKQRCSSDAESCRELIMGFCQGPPEDCLPLAACCDTCSANGVLTCLVAQQDAMTAARVGLRMIGVRNAS